VRAIRTFFAVNLSVEVVRAITSAQRTARQRCAEAGWEIKWLAPPNLHLIMRYLGDVSQAIAPPIKEELSEVVSAFPPILLHSCGVRLIDEPGGEESPRALVVNVTDETGGLQRLHSALNDPLKELGFKPSEAALECHVVVARASKAGSQPIEELLADLREQDFGVCFARELVFYRSDVCAPKGEYARLWHISFEGQAERGDQVETPAAGDDPDTAPLPAPESPSVEERADTDTLTEPPVEA